MIGQRCSRICSHQLATECVTAPKQRDLTKWPSAAEAVPEGLTAEASLQGVFPAAEAKYSPLKRNQSKCNLLQSEMLKGKGHKTQIKKKKE